MPAHSLYRLIIFLAAMCAHNQQVRAQDSLVVVDKETGTPIRDVSFRTDKGDVYTSNYLGQIHIDHPFDQASVSHASYLQRNIRREELSDTIWLLPTGIRLSEVVVWGKDRRNIMSMVMNATSDAAAYAPPKGVATFDFFKLFEKKPHNKKTRRKNEEILRDWDQIYSNEPTNQEKK